jgi:gluconokinase
MKSKVIACRAVVLMGVSGSGKSTVGRLLAAELGCPFIEGDDLHDASSIAKMSSGQSLTDQDRWPWLDRIGHAMQASISKHSVVVVACSALKQSYREKLMHVVSAPLSFILLEASREELLTRLHNRSDHFMPARLLESQLAQLEPLEDSECALTLSASAPPSELCKAIRAWL